jgi:hypothetical protein
MCPHCGILIRTTKLITPGAKARCPGCKLTFCLTPTEGSLVETIPIVGVEQEIVEVALPPRMRSTSKEPPRINGAGAPQPVEKSKPLDGERKLLFQSSRKGIVATLLLFLAAAGYGFIRWYSDQIRELNGNINNQAAARKNKLLKYADGRQSLANQGAPVGATAPLVDRDRVIAPTTCQVGNLVVGVSACNIQQVTLRSGRTLPQNHTVFTIRVTNLYEGVFSYDGFNYADNNRPVLRDQYKNYYNRLTSFDVQDPPFGAVMRKTDIPHGVTITDVVVFEGEPPSLTELDLDLTIAPTVGMFKFHIPARLIQRPTAAIAMVPPAMGFPRPPAPPDAKLDQPPPPPIPYNPEQDPQVIQKVTIDYRDGARAIERVARGKGYDAARSFRRSKTEQLLNELAEKYQLTFDQVRRMTARFR